MEQRVSLVTLGVADIGRMRAFYAALGWEEAPQSQEGVVFYQAGGVVLGLYPRHEMMRDLGLPDDARAPSGFTLALNVRAKEDVAPTLERARQAGAKILKPAQDVFWGGHCGCFADPEGNPWEIAWNPFFPFDDQGNLKLH